MTNDPYYVGALCVPPRGGLMACSLTAASCFRRYIVARGPDLSLRTGKDGWYSMPCPAGHHGKPLRLQAGTNCHVFYTDLGGCPEPEVFGALAGLGVPGECLKRPKGSKSPESQPKTSSSEGERLADLILGIAFGEGTATERLIRIALAASLHASLCPRPRRARPAVAGRALFLRSRPPPLSSAVAGITAGPDLQPSGRMSGP
jgi:hypothetical protein